MNHWIVSLLSFAALVPSYGVTATSVKECDAPVIADKHSGFVCGQRGTVPKSYYKQAVRKVYAASADECYLQCYGCLDCATVLWNSHASSCRFLAHSVPASKFHKDDSSSYVVSDRRCANPVTGCDGLWNPSFDEPHIHGDKLLVRPTRFIFNFQQVFLQPWSTFQFLGYKHKGQKVGKSFGYARLGSASDLPRGHQPIPKSNGDNFAIIRSENGASQFLIQQTTLAVNTTYTFECTYSILSYKMSPAAGNDNTYYLYFFTPYGGGPQDIVSVRFDQTNVDGMWHTATGSFTTISTLPENWFKHENNVLFATVQPYYINGSLAPGNGGFASVAIDNLKLRIAPQVAAVKAVNSVSSPRKPLLLPPRDSWFPART